MSKALTRDVNWSRNVAENAIIIIEGNSVSEEKSKEMLEKVDQVINRLFKGESLGKILKSMQFDPQVFCRWVDGDSNRQLAYERARQFKADIMAEQITDIADEETDSMKARNMIDARKWYASKMQPQRYGDRIDITLNQTVDIGSALREARNRALPQRDLEIVAKPQVLDSIGIQAIDVTGSKPVDAAESKVPVEKETSDIAPDPRGIVKGG